MKVLQREAVVKKKGKKEGEKRKRLPITVVRTLQYHYTPRFLTTQQPCCHGNTAPEERMSVAAVSCLAHLNLIHTGCLWSILATCDPSFQGQSVHWPLPWSWTHSDECRWTHQSAWLAPLHPWAEQHRTAGFIRYYVTQHHPRRPRSHYPSTPTPPPTSAPLVICRLRCIVIEECSSSDTTCGDICGGFSFGNK